MHSLRSILTFLCFVTLTATGCSVYRSSVRKDFESNSDGKIYIKSLPEPECQKINPVSAWFEKEFPEESGELLMATPELEIWKMRDANGLVHVRSFLSTADGTHTCVKEFPNEKVWAMLRSSYVEQLQDLLK